MTLLSLKILYLIVVVNSAGSSSDRHGAQSPIPSLSSLGLSPTSPCQIELQSGRYLVGISDEFGILRGSLFSRLVVPYGPEANIFCICTAPMRMVCTIVCRTSHIRDLILRRIGPQVDPLDLYPFFRDTPGSDYAQYVSPDAESSVVADIVIYYQDPSVTSGLDFGTISQLFNGEVNLETATQRAAQRVSLITSYDQLPRWRRQPLQRSASAGSIDQSADSGAPMPRSAHGSAPASLHNFPDQTIPLRVCTGGSKGVACPITHMEFEPGQIVYILKKERDKALGGSSVGCISAEGMKRLRQDDAPNASFRDPLRRTGDRLLTIENDFEAFVISGDTDGESSASGDEETHVQVSTFNQTKNTIPLFILMLVCIILLKLFFNIVTSKPESNLHSPLL